MILNLILDTIGFSTIDENLQKLIEQMKSFPEDSIISSTIGYAKILGLCIALGIGSYECWMMMLGKRGMDVMQILRIIIISLCISMSGWICSAASVPGEALGDMAKDLALAKNQEVSDLEEQVQTAQNKYLAQLDTILQRAQMQRQSHDEYAKSKDGGLFNIDIGASIDEISNNFKFMIKKWALALETKITEFLSIIIRFVGEVIFQISYYGLLVAQNVFMEILKIFCPILFALSLAPPFKSAWSQWLSKYISLSLWGFVIYMILYYVNFIMIYNLNLDLVAYQNFLGDLSADSFNWETVGSFGMQGLGTTCMYVVGLLVGVFCLKFVPEVASWLIPGGVSSGVGSGAVGAATGGVNKVVGAASAATGVSAITGAPTRMATSAVDKTLNIK